MRIWIEIEEGHIADIAKAMTDDMLRGGYSDSGKAFRRLLQAAIDAEVAKLDLGPTIRATLEEHIRPTVIETVRSRVKGVAREELKLVLASADTPEAAR